MNKVEKLDCMTRKVLRAIPPGQTRRFALPNYRKCLSAQAITTQLKKTDKIVYHTTTDSDTNIITITREDPA